jgi:hypothetical protein
MDSPTAGGRGQPPTVYLHIGTPKSGTTYLQSRFSANSERAAAQGLLWPGPGWGRHVAAARELRRLADGESPAADGPWLRLVHEARAWRGRAVLISMEWLASLSPHQIRAAVESLQPAPVEVICTARDLLRSFVAQGQEMSKNYRTWTWAQLEEEVLSEADGPAQRTFWRQQDLPRILGRWLEVVPGDGVHLVTLPPAGGDPGVLWERFCTVVGIDGSGFEEAPSANASLGVVSTALMQRLNAVAAERGLDHRVYKQALHKGVAVSILGPRRKQEGPIALGEEMDTYLRKRAERMVEELQGFGLDLLGEWSDLVPTAPLSGRRPTEISDSELLEVSLEALVTLAVQCTERRRARAPLGRARRVARRVRRRVRSDT